MLTLCCLFVIAGTLLAATSRPSPLELVLFERGDRSVIFCRPTAVDQIFSFAFTHSMFGGEVAENYRVNTDGMIVRTSVISDHAGAADYYGLYGESRRQDGRYTLQIPALALDELPFLATDRAGYRLEGPTWSFTVPTPAGVVRHLVLRVERRDTRSHGPCLP